MVELKGLDPQSLAIWRMLFEVSAKQSGGWTLVGAQMVALHGFERGRPRPHSSFDTDLVADARIMRGGTRRLCLALMELGFELPDIGPDGFGHRFKRGGEIIDVLAPDGVGERADLTTVPPARTMQVPGGSQALARTEMVEVSLEGMTARIPRPNLLAAILLKARAVEVDDRPDHQRLDLAFLLSLVEDPRVLARGLKPTVRKWLRRRSDLLDQGNRAWREIDNAEEGYLALRILADFPSTRS